MPRRTVGILECLLPSTLRYCEMESIREFASRSRSSRRRRTGGAIPATSMTPKAFETTNTGWTIES
jgi:hypothetical protein